VDKDTVPTEVNAMLARVSDITPALESVREAQSQGEAAFGRRTTILNPLPPPLSPRRRSVARR